MNLRLSPPDPVLEALRRLADNGHEAYLVGGCVRDALLRRDPADWDICTSAHPDRVKSLFPGSLETGMRHGTLTALMPFPGTTSPPSRLPVEITTFRAESGYTDHRHPDVVRFCPDLTTDLSRRDFTINAMAWHPDTGLVDPFGGQMDLADGRVRCVGDPLRRFSEDALRMLRAIRFCSQLAFALDPDALQAIRHRRHDILHVSPERIQVEMTRTLTGMAPSQAALWWTTSLSSSLFDPLLPPEEIPGLQEAPADPLLAYEHGRSAGPFSPHDGPDPGTTGWALVLQAGKMAGDPNRLLSWMKRYRFPKARINGIRKLLELMALLRAPSDRNLRRYGGLAGDGWVWTALVLKHFLDPQFPPPVTLLPPKVPMPDGDRVTRLLLPGWRPEGHAFGAFLSCLQMARSEQPMLADGELPEEVVQAMRDAAFRLHKAPPASTRLT